VTQQSGSISSAIRQNVRQIDLFNGLLDDEIDILIKHSKIRALGEDETLFVQGDDSDFFVVIIDGRIEITKYSDKETPVSLASLTKGDTLGEMALFTQETRSASATATVPSIVLILSRASFDLLVYQNPRCGTKLLRKLAIILCSHLRKTSKMFAETIEPHLLT